jgi:3-deoxy-manno-octulosonate cytidylyltransferase (CMP-KDO synthetase)
MKVVGLIPCRLESTRLNRKVLLEIQGLPMIIHVYKRAKLSTLDEVYVCTDSQEVIDICDIYNVPVIKTKHHINGTDRIAEVAKNIEADYFVDVQGDEVLVNPQNINRVINFHKQTYCDIVLPSVPIVYNENINIVKVKEIDGSVVDLSRNSISYLKHFSIISFTSEALKKFSQCKPTFNEIHNQIELLRAIENKFDIKTIKIACDSFSVDTRKDYENAVEYMKSDNIVKTYL